MKLGNKKFQISFFASIAIIGLLLSSCGNKSGRRTASDPGGFSASTGAEYSFDERDEDEEVEGDEPFQVFRLPREVVGPRLVFIQGGRAVLGSQEQDIMGFRDNVERTVTIASFYMDETEVTNVDYKEFLFNMAKRDGVSEDSIQKLEPNERVWDGTMSYNDVYATYYFRYPGFNFYPVAGVSWNQAMPIGNEESFISMSWRGMKNELNSGLYQGPQLLKEDLFSDNSCPMRSEWEFASKGQMIGTQYKWTKNQENENLAPGWTWSQNPYNMQRKSRQGRFSVQFKKRLGVTRPVFRVAFHNDGKSYLPMYMIFPAK